tara:strand:+ start:532 stop:1011 length:480 start_codon:yes stop_codon:yes gene_type:complete
MEKNKKYILSIFLIIYFVFNSCAFSKEYKKNIITIIDPWIKINKINTSVASGYLKLKNNTNEDDVLISVRSDFSQKSEIHEMTMVKNVMKMSKLENGIQVPVGKEIVLNQGGLHLMFKNIDEKLEINGYKYVQLKFKKFGNIKVKFYIKNFEHSKKHDH